ncbi:hypothetical protein PHYSODRAFT_262753 [Phytophthora sojae]|uniref:PIGA GPI anchor biosynthesis domain-containing protein n=1 Tax=Phytophthora sojae (strain P6497) TaxID=1094619 RepID=G5AB39_PHYSP|nr:hypothetical protein PHYSODRAFT_262753 [Phytophthora sojae]EGZ07184.1 hypothetical protein PHYSODRAFT_262753 [Phytophthora sojae]|eukprot:XP_009536750.1 hypothetical protein PHYSODRAFT_262753 [Phytophthora sojae]
MPIRSLSQCLLRGGHNVILLTYAVPGPKVRVAPTAPPTPHSARGRALHDKLYYLPVMHLLDIVTYMTFVGHLALFRAIRTKALDLDVKTVYTDHSLFGFVDAASVLLNKIINFLVFSNLVLRASLREGLESGFTRLLLEEMLEKHRRHYCVTLYGAVPGFKVRDVLCQDHIFLNRQLAGQESLYFTILEATKYELSVCGKCYPPDVVQFTADITPEALAEAALAAELRLAGVDRQDFQRA